MRRLYILVLALVMFAARTAFASPVTYGISLDTSSLQGTTGSVDFNFDPGPLGSQEARAQIGGLVGTAPSGAAMLTGSTSGTLPGMVTFDNSMAYNDYFQAVTFGPSLVFDVTLMGSALDAPNGSSLSGSTFAFSIFSDAAGTTPALTTDANNGYAVTIDVNLEGSTTVTNYSNGTVSGLLPARAATPEPGTWMLVATGVLGGARWARRRRTV